MPRRWPTVMLVVAVALTMVVSARPARSVQAQSPFTTFVGDSITAGLYAPSPAAGYVGQLERHWRRGTYASVGVPGATAAGIRAHVPEIPSRTTLLIVEIGTNDYQHDHSGPRFWGDYRALLAALRHRAPAARLICIGPWEPADGVNAAGESVSYMQEQIYTACGTGWEVVLSDLFDNPSLRGPEGAPTAWGPADWFHPNAMGHSWIAYRVSDAVRRGR